MSERKKQQTGKTRVALVLVKGNKLVGCRPFSFTRSHLDSSLFRKVTCPIPTLDRIRWFFFCVLRFALFDDDDDDDAAAAVVVVVRCRSCKLLTPNKSIGSDLQSFSECTHLCI